MVMYIFTFVSWTIDRPFRTETMYWPAGQCLETHKTIFIRFNLRNLAKGRVPKPSMVELKCSQNLLKRCACREEF